MSTASRVSSNAMFLLLGSVGTQALNLVYASILARYVGVAGLGKISTAQALMASAFILVNFGFNVSLVREVAADLSRARTYVPTVIYLRLLFTVVVTVVMTGVVQLSPYPNDTKIIIGLYGLVNVLDALSNTLRCIFNAYQRMGARATIEFLRQAINVGLSLVGIYLGWTLIQLVVVSVVASLWRTLVTAWVIRRRFVRLEWGFDRALAGHLLKVSVPYFLGYLVSVLTERFNVVLLSWLSTPEAVGIFSAAMLPVLTVLFVPDMIMDSVFPVMASAYAKSRVALVKTYEVSFRVMLLVGFPMGAGAALVATDVMTLIFGDEFASAGPVMAILSLHLCTIAGYVNGYFLGATARQGLFTSVRAVLATLGLGLYFLLIPRLGLWGAVVTFLTVSLLDFVILTVVCLGVTQTRFPWGVALKLAAACGVMYGLGYVLQETLHPPLWILIPVSMVVYVVAVALFRGVGADELDVLRRTRPGAALEAWLAKVGKRDTDTR